MNGGRGTTKREPKGARGNSERAPKARAADWTEER